MSTDTYKQVKAFEKLSRLKVGALFMEMGTGKTKVALDLIASKLHKLDVVLWVCPVSLKNEIESERLKWYPELSLHVVGCESIGSSDRIYLETYNLIKDKRVFMVVDESLKIKNREAQRTQRILKLGEFATYKLILNGTPLSKNVLDLYTQMQFLSPKILDMSYDEFKNTYCEYYIRGKLKGLVKKQHNVNHLVAKIEPYIFDSKLEIAARKHYFDYAYTMDDTEGYQSIKDDFFNSLSFDVMPLFQRLQSHYCKSTEKQKIIDELIQNINGQIIVVVKFLNSIPEDAHSLQGCLVQSDRRQVIEDFKTGKFKVLYMTYGTGSLGLNLQTCKNMIFADHTFDYALREQMEARIYRMGQTEDVTYYNLWCRCGMEDMIRGSLDKKSNLLNEVKKEIEERGIDEWLKDI